MTTIRRIVTLPLLVAPLLWAANVSAQQEVPFNSRTGYPVAPQGLKIPPLPDAPVHYKTAEDQDIRVVVLARGLTQGRSGLRTGGGAALAAPPFLNVNLPNLPLADIKGVVVTRLAPQGYRDTVNQGTDGRRPWHWIARDQPPAEAAEGTDFWAVRNGMVSVTPLSTDITAHDAMPAVSDLVRSLPLPPVRD